MPVTFFQVSLSVQPKSGGNAEILLPKALKGLNYQFIIVKEGGEEGIVKVDVSEAMLKKVEEDKNCKKLPAEQVEKLRKSYPAPKIKKKFHMRPQPPGTGEAVAGIEQFEVDDKGNRIVDAIQTVRSGYYLIDVPVLGQLEE